MPFTVTHIAAVVPVAWLCRWRLPLSALAIGSMVPDVSGYYPRIFDYDATHSIRGLFTHAVPLGLIAFYIFHLILKRPLIDILPDGLRRRLRPWSDTEVVVHPLGIFAVIACLILGACTHVLWDSFTHENAWGVQTFPMLNEVVTEAPGRPIRLFSILQHLSSLMVLPPLMIGFFWWVYQQPLSPLDDRDTRSAHRIVAWGGIILMAIGAWLYFHSLRSHYVNSTAIAALRLTVKHCGAVSLVLLLVYSIAMHFVWWREETEQNPDDSGPPPRRDNDLSSADQPHASP